MRVFSSNEMVAANWLSIVLVLLFLLLPLEASGFALAIIILAFFALYLRRAGNVGANVDIRPAALMLVFTLGTGVIFSLDVTRSIQGGVKTLPGILLVYAWLQVARKGWFSDDGALYVAVILGCMLAFGAFGYSQFLHSGYVSRIEGIFQSGMRNSISVAFLFLLCGIMGCYQAGGRQVFLLAGVLMLWVLMAHGGRGAFIAGGAVVLWVSMLRIGFWLRHMLMAAMAAIVVIGGALWMWGLPEGMVRTEGGFLTGRGSLWSAAFKVMLEYPLTGIGINVWKYSPFVHGLSEGWINQPSPHNFVLDVLTSLGLVGTLLLLAAIFKFAAALRAAPLAISPAFRGFGLCLLTGFLVNALVDFRVFSVQFFAAVGVAMVLYLGGAGQRGVCQAGTDAAPGKDVMS